MARKTFFSFHYKPDVHRAWNVRNAWVAKVAQGSREDAGFFDSSVFEAAQRTDDEALKRFLREGLKGTSVTCVLVGEHTAIRRWVRYEIFRSFICGNGLLAVRINSIKNLQGLQGSWGQNPFECTAFTIEGDRMRFQEMKTSGWAWASDVGSMPLNEVAYNLGGRTNHTLNSLFPIYDWAADNGRDNLGYWIEQAAASAGR